MRNSYFDLIDQTFYWPQNEFKTENHQLLWHNLPVMHWVEKYGTPLKISYLPKISERIHYARTLFQEAMQKVNYQSRYHYCYCTKSSHFSFVLEEALGNGIHLETSSGYDLDLAEALYHKGWITKEQYIVCNGFKRPYYIQKIADWINRGFANVFPVFDNVQEVNQLVPLLQQPARIGIRIAAEEEPKFAFYTSRLGVGYQDVLPFYRDKIRDEPLLELKMLHFFINTGIQDTAYYWSELLKCVQVYIQLKKECSSLDSLNIGGGFPVKNTLHFTYDYPYMAQEIIAQVKQLCNEAGVAEPDIFTEFGSFTVGESGATIFSVLDQKKQNDREYWNMIDGSFMTTLPDAWAINKRFIMLAINRWDQPYQRILLGGLTCDSDDYYNSEQHANAVYLPRFDPQKTQYVGFFNTGAYQDSLAGYGGIQHCLIPAPRHVVLRQQGDAIQEELFAPEQSAQSMLRILGY